MARWATGAAVTAAVLAKGGGGASVSSGATSSMPADAKDAHSGSFDAFDRGYDRYGNYGSYASYGSYGNYGFGSPYSSYMSGRDLYDRGDPYGGYGGFDSKSSGFSGYGSAMGSDGKANTDDDCSRVEAQGVSLPGALREAAENLGDAPFDEAPSSLRELAIALAGEQHRRFLLAHCPQAVVLATLLLQADASNESAETLASLRTAGAAKIGELLTLAPTLRAPFRIPPQWTGHPWELPLSAMQQRTGIVLFPTGEQLFQVDFVPPANWSIHPRRRCAGRRDLGNLQATPLERCLEKCASHPLCRSATFWHWQPGGFGFEQRCFLSSTCTPNLATAEGAEGAVLFEKRGWQLQEEEALRQHTVLTRPGGTPWAPRCGHRLAASPRQPLAGSAMPVGALKATRLWLLGGVGVDPFVNTSATSTSASPVSTQSPPIAATTNSGIRPRGAAAVAAAKAQAAARNATSGTTGNVIEAYLSRHVELSGELPPLRSLPYGRLGDVWTSDDLGATWALASKAAPWGPRAFFGASVLRGGEALLVFGGIQSSDDGTTPAPAGMRNLYSNEVWCADLARSSSTVGGAGEDMVLEWKQLPSAAWAARAGFQALVLGPDPVGDDADGERLFVLGGRLSNGNVVGDVWSAVVGHQKQPLLPAGWHLVNSAAAWEPRADFAATVGADGEVWLFGGSGRGGRALADVWRSTGAGREWSRVNAAAPWGPCVGAMAATLGDVLMLYGGYTYPNAEFGPLTAGSSEVATGADHATSAWASRDGVHWVPLNGTHTAWSPNTMHSALAVAPCGDGGAAGEATACAYVTGGLTHEGYYDNTAHRITMPIGSEIPMSQTTSEAERPTGIAVVSAGPTATMTILWGSSLWDAGPMLPMLLVPILSTPVFLFLRTWRRWPRKNSDGADANPTGGMDPATRRAMTLLGATCFFCTLLVVLSAAKLVSLSNELEALRSTEVPQCRVDEATVETLRKSLGVAEVGTLLRLASREPAFGSYGSYDSLYRGGKSGYSDFGGRGFSDRGWGGYGYDAYGGGLYGDGFGYGDEYSASQDAADPGRDAAINARELATLPTTQALSCRSPRCDRNATSCAAATPRSMKSPYGCCSDYMLLMFSDVAEWLDQQQIPYFITYGTLLGALREQDVLPWTQDMDIVVDRAHWPKLQRGLEAAEFFGGRRYLFGVDQWEERVSRVCADWEGFAASTIGGPDGDRFSRATDFHLDIYASDWWQVKDLHLVDCVEPLDSAVPLQIRGRNFSAPARPRACVEKLYGAEWRTPKQALSGVN